MNLRLKQLITIGIGLGVIITLGAKFPTVFASKDRVDACGKVILTFNGLPPNAPVFSAPDVKPGDCYDQLVTAKNEGKTTAWLSVRANKIKNADHLANVMFLTITEGNQILYGQGNSKTINQFFKDTDNLEGVYLSEVKPNKTTQYHFKACLPSSTGNQYQKAKLTFDLEFLNNTSKPSYHDYNHDPDKDNHSGDKH